MRRMRPHRRIHGLIAFVLAAGGACSHSAPAPSSPAKAAPTAEGADEDDTPVQQADLPAPVQATVAAQSKGATIHGLSRSTEDGRESYELELVMPDGHRKDLDIGVDGTVLGVEEEVQLDSVPEAAKAAIQKQAGDRKITRVEMVSKGDGTLRGYEVGVTDGTKRAELHVAPDGSTLPDDDDD